MRVTLLLLAWMAAPAWAAPRAFELDDLFKMDRLASAALSPDGEWVAAISERWTEQSYWATHSRLWLISTRTGKMSQPVALDESPTQPTWSRDGQLLAYIAKKDGSSSLQVLRLRGQPHVESLPACNEKETISAATWSPDDAELAVMCDAPVEPDSTHSTVIIASQSILYRGKAAPWAHRRAVLVNLATRTSRQLAKNDTFLTGEGALLWSSPTTLSIVATPDTDYAGNPWVEGRILHQVDITTGAITPIVIPKSGSGMPTPSPDGTQFMLPAGKGIAYMDRTNWRGTWKLRPFVAERVTSDGKVLSTTAPLEIFSQSKQAWATGDTYYIQWLDQASVRVKALSLATGHWSDITPANKEVKDFSLSTDGRKMAVVMGDANTPFEVYILDLRHPSKLPEPLTHFGAAIHELYAVSSVEPLTWRSKDNRFDVHGYLLKPAGAIPGKRYPLIVDVHGGPGVLFHNAFDVFHFEGAHQVAPELYAAKGYMVLMVNPRGDPGYGRAYQEALREGWPNATRYDIFTGVDEIIKRGYVDPDQLGIAGASYGGWVTAFAVTQTHRFKAASANDPVINTSLASAVAYRGDRLSNYWMMAGFSSGQPGDTPQQDIAPDQVKTPILLRFGLKGLDEPFTSEFPISGLPYFAYLDSHCVVPVEMIVHPEEAHGIFNWTTLRDYIGRDLAWFDYWIKGEGTAPVKPRECHGNPAP